MLHKDECRKRSLPPIFALRIASLVAILGIGWGYIPVLAQESDEQSTQESLKIVSDPSFETHIKGLPGGWRAPADTYAWDNSVSKSGAASFRWQNADAERYHLSSLPLALEPGRAYEIFVWVKTQNVCGGKAAFCVEWSDENGKWLGGDYSRGISGTADWTQVRCFVTPPKNARNIHLTCYGTRGATGTAWFDDIEIRPFFIPCVSAMTTDHYRHQTTGGTMKILVGIAPMYALSDVRNSITLRVSGESLPTPIFVEPSAFGTDSIEFSLNAESLACGKYVATCEVLRPDTRKKETVSLTITRLSEFPERKSYIDKHNRLILDGEPFFPLGLYFGAVKPEDVERLEKSAFNCIMPYHQISRESLDLLYAHGIRTIYSVKDLYEGLAVKTDEEGREKTIQKINEMKDHPGIIAWYINDELPLTMLRELAGHRDLVESLDPGRPTWVVLYQINEIRSYISTFDVVGTDPYPLPNKPISLAWEWSRMTNEAVFHRHATWQVPQIFNWANYRKSAADQKNSHTPTYDEMRAMIWMNIAGGANGIVCYSYYDLFRDDAAPGDDENTKMAKFEKRWADVTKIAEEVASRIPILLSIEEPMRIMPVPEESSTVATRCYSKDGKTYLLLVNSTREPQSVAFDVPSGARLSPESSLGSSRATLSEGRLSVELAPIAPVWVILL
ncbi:MAG: hypothetical protein Q4D38_03250 [Planctomycetia bacterium]|nr:hypothetical protein [Planctomycetia bacterium]